MINTEETTIWELMGKSFSGSLSEEEKKVLQEWRESSEENEATYLQCKEIWDNSKYLSFFNSEKGWVKLKKRISLPSRKKFSFINSSSYAVAAGLVLLLAIGIIFKTLNSRTKRIITYETTKVVVLSDGSTIELNKHSELSYPRHFKGDLRTVNLIKGEAFFSIKRENRPFWVKTSHAFIQVLGTQFNVNIQNNGNVEVIVENGKVAFMDAKKSQHVILKSKEGALFTQKNNKIITLLSFDPNLLAWKTHRLVFKNNDLSYVFNIIKRTYGIVIDADEEIRQYRLTATFENQPPDDILRIIAKTFTIHSKQINDSHFLLTKNKISVQP